MYVTFYGATREVTGSMHMITTGKDRLLLDCGMFQGRRKESDRKNRVLPFDPKIVTNTIISHAHIDHSGRVPLIVKNGYSGRVVCTRATSDVCHYLLMDSAHIQESDARYLNYKAARGFLYDTRSGSGSRSLTKRTVNDIKKMLKKGPHEINTEAIAELQDKYSLKKVSPLYTKEDAEDALGYLDGYPFKYSVTVGSGATCKFYIAGHILGSAITVLTIEEKGRFYKIMYTGDLGRFDKPIIQDPTLEFEDEDKEIDLMLCESTYGDRDHEPVQDMSDKLKEVITRTVERGGSVLIPSFAFGRTQELIYVIHKLYDEGAVPKIPIYIDSPLAIKLTKVFAEHPESYDRDTHSTFLEKGENPFDFKHLDFVNSVQESMALMRETQPHIVLSASGMCEAGRILHHLRYKIHNPNNTILLVGYMAQNTLGRKIEDMGMEYMAAGKTGPAPEVKILGKVYPLTADVVKLGGFSGHGDRNEIIKVLTESNLKIKKIAVIHGEEDQSEAFAQRLTEKGFNAFVPYKGESVMVD
ncbi:MBL fold metallo-hydrolase RNA specificity domain-containing protein [candidate division KSB1 bacterium]